MLIFDCNFLVPQNATLNFIRFEKCLIKAVKMKREKEDFFYFFEDSGKILIAQPPPEASFRCKTDFVSTWNVSIL